MILYHFTSDHHLPAIRREGLTKGALPWTFRGEAVIFKRPMQALTANATFEQHWSGFGKLPFARNTWRIQVDIPAAVVVTHLKRWESIARTQNPRSAEYLNDIAGKDANLWWFFHGEIPPAWLVDFTRNPNRIDLIRPEFNHDQS